MGLTTTLYAVRVFQPMEDALIERAVRDVVHDMGLGLPEMHYETTVRVSLGSWGRAYAVHRWVLANTFDRDLRRYLPTRDHLTDLRERCRRVLHDEALADELFPEGAGILPYVGDLERTISLIDRALQLDEAAWGFEYDFGH